MADQIIAKDQKTLNVPEETKIKFPDLIEFIQGSHSMDDEERQYWVDVLPIMTEDQIKNLRDILTNEKKQIEEANRAYAGATKKTGPVFDEEAYREKKKMRIEAERKQEEEEKRDEAEVLKSLQDL